MSETRQAGDELLVLIVPPTLEENMIDWLLAHDRVNGFSSTTVFGHSSNVNHASVAEQVAGRKRQLQFQIHLSGEDTLPVMRDLREEFCNSGLHYWRIPLASAGQLQQCEDDDPGSVTPNE